MREVDRVQATHGRLATQVKELERCQRELNLLREIDQKLLAGVALPDLLQAAVGAFARLAEAQSCVLVTADPESGLLKPVASAGPDLEVVRRYYADLRPRLGEGDVGKAIAMRTAVMCPDITQEPGCDQFRVPLLSFGIRAILAVPLLADEQILGAVALGYPEPRTFPEAEVQALQVFANQLAVAFAHARLREEAAERWRCEQGSRVKTLFIANMSHELRTPLNSIIGFSELLEGGLSGPLNDKQKRYARNIHEAGKHLLALINDLLDLAKVEAGKIRLRPEPLLLPETLESAVMLMHGEAMRKGLTLEQQVEEGLPKILADPVRLNQILFNLLSNAVKFTPGGGQVRVAARLIQGSQLAGHDELSSGSELSTLNREPQRSFVEISVQDTGIGIKSEDLPKLFQPFVQLDSSFANRHQGTGLGLALTKQLVELHGGQIVAASDGEGRGSTFTVRLPLAPAGEVGGDNRHDDPGSRG